MACLRCGSSGQWQEDRRFCSVSCRERFYDEARPREQTLDDFVLDLFAEDYETALRECRGISGAPVHPHELTPDRAPYYAEKLLQIAWPDSVLDRAAAAAKGEVAPEHPPKERSPFQEAVRALLVRWWAPRYKIQPELRADTRACMLVDALDGWRRQEAARYAMRGPPPPDYRLEAELVAHDAEARYEADQQRRRRRKRDPRLTGERAIYPC